MTTEWQQAPAVLRRKHPQALQSTNARLRPSILAVLLKKNIAKPGKTEE